MSRSTWILMIAALLAGTTAVGEIHKWVDDKEGVHYGDCAPADCAGVPVEVAPPPSDAAVRSGCLGKRTINALRIVKVVRCREVGGRSMA